jgi:hypothetical protein
MAVAPSARIRLLFSLTRPPTPHRYKHAHTLQLTPAPPLGSPTRCSSSLSPPPCRPAGTRCNRVPRPDGSDAACPRTSAIAGGARWQGRDRWPLHSQAQCGCRPGCAGPRSTTSAQRTCHTVGMLVHLEPWPPSTLNNPAMSAAAKTRTRAHSEQPRTRATAAGVHRSGRN